VDEFEIIRRYFARASADDSVLLGIGDDAAVLRPEPGRDLVTVLDSLVAGVHYPHGLTPRDIGYRAVAVNLSDIAAMGGRPRWMTLGLTLHEADSDWIAGFASGLFEAADEHGVELVGGDTTHGSEVVISVQISGDIEGGRSLKRSGAKHGDAIYVSGTPGDAAAGLSMLQSNAPRSAASDYLVSRFTRPEPRLTLGQSLLETANAAIDLSDGLFTDLEKLLGASSVAGVIEFDDIPLSTQITGLMERPDALRFALAGGDDYELCFTASEERFAGVAELAGVPVRRIGQVTAGSGLSCTRGGEPYPYSDDGYRHFR